MIEFHVACGHALPLDVTYILYIIVHRVVVEHLFGVGESEVRRPGPTDIVDPAPLTMASFSASENDAPGQCVFSASENDAPGQCGIIL